MINTEQAHDIGFPSLEVTLLNNVKLSRICRHSGFAMATGGRKPVACSKMLIFSHLVNFGRNFPSSLLRWQNGLGTAWPGREPGVKRPELLLPWGQSRGSTKPGGVRPRGRRTRSPMRPGDACVHAAPATCAHPCIASPYLLEFSCNGGRCRDELLLHLTAPACWQGYKFGNLCVHAL